MERLLERVASSCTLWTKAGISFGSVFLNEGDGLDALRRWNVVVAVSILWSCSFETPIIKQTEYSDVPVIDLRY